VNSSTPGNQCAGGPRSLRGMRATFFLCWYGLRVKELCFQGLADVTLPGLPFPIHVSTLRPVPRRLRARYPTCHIGAGRWVPASFSLVVVPGAHSAAAAAPRVAVESTQTVVGRAACPHSDYIMYKE
jgi:hypothetical protein